MMAGCPTDAYIEASLAYRPGQARTSFPRISPPPSDTRLPSFDAVCPGMPPSNSAVRLPLIRGDLPEFPPAATPAPAPKYYKHAGLHSQLLDRAPSNTMELLSTPEDAASSTSEDGAIEEDNEEMSGTMTRRPSDSFGWEEVASSSTEQVSSVPVNTSVSPSPAPAFSKTSHKVVYYVTCSSIHFAKHHAARFYHDRPSQSSTYDAEKAHHCKGNWPIHNLSEFLTSGEKSFLVFRHVKCEKATEVDAEEHERLFTLAPSLQDAMTSTASCYFDYASAPEWRDWDHEREGLVVRELIPLVHQEISRPDYYFFHHEAALVQYAACNPAARQHVEALLDYVRGRYGAQWEEARTLFRASSVNQKHICRLFKPNSILVCPEREVAFVLRLWPWTKDSSNEKRLDCWSWGPDGSEIARVKERLHVAPLWDSVVPIDSLTVVPIEFAPPYLLQALAFRGERVWNMLRSNAKKLVSYELLEADAQTGDQIFVIDYSAQRDVYATSDSHGEVVSAIYPFDRRPEFEDTCAIRPCLETLMLLPRFVQGFNLSTKAWISVDVADVHPRRWQRKAFDRLVLSPSRKELLKVLFENWTRDVRQVGRARAMLPKSDILRGKGNGLTILLQGRSGTGKTLTAESLAEYFRMPLYRVSSGEVGPEPEDVEQYIKDALYLAWRWNCLLLFDEGDILPQTVSASDPRSSRLVSTLLHKLDSYEGVLMLTTSCTVLDEHFKSRFQVALHCEELPRLSRRKVWQNMLEMSKEDGGEVDCGDVGEHIEDLAEPEMNGRDIRNALTTARQLAQYECKPLAWKHLQDAIAIFSDFNSDMRRLQNLTLTAGQ